MFVSVGCNVCGKPVSMGIEVPEGFKIGAWIECQECMLAKGPSVPKVIAILSERLMRPEFYGGGDLHRTKLIDAAARDIVRSLDNQRFHRGS